MAQQTIDPRKYILNFSGVTILMFAKGKMIEVDFDSDAFSDEVGATGDVVRILSLDQRGTIKFMLMRNSPSNDVLSAFAVADRLTGAVTGPVSVRDILGASFAGADVAWIKKIPPNPFSSESETITWEIRCAQLKNFIGGTAPT